MENSEIDDGFRISLSIGSRLDHVWSVRKVLAAIFENLHVNERDSLLIQLAITEIVNNIIEHGYGNKVGQVEISVHLANSLLEVAVTDDGMPIPHEELNSLVTTALLEPTDEWPERGHGMAIVRRVMDDVRFSRMSGRNQVLLSKKLLPSAPAT